MLGSEPVLSWPWAPLPFPISSNGRYTRVIPRCLSRIAEFATGQTERHSVLPRISIITVTFNAAETLASCLQSVVQQTMPVEHILVDGGSTDATLAIAEHYSGHLAQVISEPDKGPYDAMNKGIQLATGDIIGILNADDFRVVSNRGGVG